MRKIFSYSITPSTKVRNNHSIVERLKFLDSMQAYKDIMAFNIGARVSFGSDRDGHLLETLLKFNRKTVTVVTDNGQKWNCSGQPFPDTLLRSFS